MVFLAKLLVLLVEVFAPLDELLLIDAVLDSTSSEKSTPDKRSSTMAVLSDDAPHTPPRSAVPLPPLNLERAPLCRASAVTVACDEVLLLDENFPPADDLLLPVLLYGLFPPVGDLLLLVLLCGLFPPVGDLLVLVLLRFGPFPLLVGGGLLLLTLEFMTEDVFGLLPGLRTCGAGKREVGERAPRAVLPVVFTPAILRY